MSRLLKFLMVCALAMGPAAALAVDGPAFAQAPATQPAPELSPTPMPTPGDQPVAANGSSVKLFECVKYKDEKDIAPCAVPMIVTVKDPCHDCDKCDPCCQPKCVAVQICVPPCSPCPPKVCCKNGGSRVTYDYGKYRIKITSKKGVVTVNYDA